MGGGMGKGENSRNVAEEKERGKFKKMAKGQCPCNGADPRMVGFSFPDPTQLWGLQSQGHSPRPTTFIALTKPFNQAQPKHARSNHSAPPFEYSETQKTSVDGSSLIFELFMTRVSPALR